MLPDRERKLTFSEAAAHVRQLHGTGHNRKAIYRWAACGLRGIVLESTLIGGHRHTSAEALARFFAAVNALPSYHSGPPSPRGMSREAAAKLIT